MLDAANSANAYLVCASTSRAAAFEDAILVEIYRATSAGPVRGKHDVSQIAYTRSLKNRLTAGFRLLEDASRRTQRQARQRPRARQQREAGVLVHVGDPCHVAHHDSRDVVIHPAIQNVVGDSSYIFGREFTRDAVHKTVDVRVTLPIR